MTEAEMKRVIGLLADAVADVAFQGAEMDGQDAQDLLKAAGLTTTRPATEEDCENSEYDVEPGDEWHALTPFALACCRVARPVST